jgi:hypothetical protein
MLCRERVEKLQNDARHLFRFERQEDFRIRHNFRDRG